MPGLMVAGGISGKIELLNSGSLNFSGGNGASRAASYTFEKSCNFIVLSTSGNKWNDGSQHNISASNAKSFSTAKYQFSHSQGGVGGSTIVGIGTAVKGTSVTIQAGIRADGTASIAVPYAIYSM